MTDVRVVHSDGTTGSVPEAKLDAALKAGWHLETPEEAAQRTGGGPIRAAVEGAARGAIDTAALPARALVGAANKLTGRDLGKDITGAIDKATGGTGKGESFEDIAKGGRVLKDLATIGGEAASGVTGKTGEAFGREYDENARATAMANPVASTLGYIGGGLATAGAGGVNAALTGLGTRTAAGLAARGAGAVASRAGGLATAGAVEGGLQGAAQASEDAWLENTQQTSERVLANIGIGALVGGGLGAGLGAAVGKFEQRAAQKAALGATKSAEDAAIETVAGRALGVEPAPGLGGKLKEAVTGNLGKAYEKVAATLSGADEATVAKYGAHKVLMRDAEALNGLELAVKRDAIIEGSIGEMTDAVSAMKRESQDVLDQVVDSALKKDHVARLIADVDKDAALMAARERAAELSKKLSFLDDAETFGDNKWAAGARKYVKDNLDDVMSGALGAEDSYMALDAVKRQLQKLGKKAEGGAAGQTMDLLKRDQLQAYANLSKEAAEDVRTHLTDEGLWGKQATAQKRANAAWEEYLRTSELASRNLMTRTGDDYGRAVMEVDPAKVAQFMSGLGTKKAELTERYIREHLAATRNLVDEISQGYELAEKAGKVASVRQAYGRIESTLAQAEKTVKVANQVEAMLAAERTGAASVFGGSPFLTGSVLGGVPGAAIGLASNAVLRPGTAALQAARLVALAGNTTKRMNGALGRFFGHAAHSAEGAAKTIAKVATRETGRRVATGAALQGATAQAPVEHRERVAELAANPTMLAEQVKEFLGPATSSLPDSHMAMSAIPMRAIQFLASKLPPAPPPHALDGASKAPISPVDQDRFNEYVKGATDPLSVIDDFADGFVTPEAIEAVQAVYPTIWEDMRIATFDFVAARSEMAEPLPYNKRIQLDMVFGGKGAIEPTADPRFMRTIEQIAKPPAPPPRPARRGGGKGPDLASAFASPLNRLSRM